MRGKLLCVIGNQSSYAISSDELDRTRFKIWDGQRSLNGERVKELMVYQENKFKTDGYFCFRGALLLCKNLSTNDMWLIDGQHRYVAMKGLIDKGRYPVFDIRIDVLDVKSASEILKEFQDVNRSIPVPINVLKPNDIVNIATKLLEKKFPKAFSKEKTSRPRINIDAFKSALIDENIVETFKINEHQLYDSICKLHTDYLIQSKDSLVTRLAHNNKAEQQTIKNLLAKCFTGDFLCIGLFKQGNPMWVNDLIAILA